VNAFVDVPFEVYPGMNGQHSLLSQHFMRTGAGPRYLRHDYRIWESGVGKGPRVRGDDGRLLLGDEILDDWRARTSGRGTARLRAYYDVLPARNSEVALHATSTNPWGDPLPVVSFVDSPESAALREYSETTIEERFRELVDAGGGEVMSVRPSDAKEHPGGGCRMGADPTTSVVDSHGRSHDHENLFVVGAPTFVTAGCTNGTLTMAALGIRAAAELGREFAARAPA
jgi:quinoprotein glucose dehydrogenase